MPLLTQLYAPLDGSNSERVVYTWACPVRACRGQPGSVRAWRANIRWPYEAPPVAVAPPAAPLGLDLGSLIFGAPPSIPISAIPPPLVAPEVAPLSPAVAPLCSIRWSGSRPQFTPHYLTTAYEPAVPVSSNSAQQGVEGPMPAARDDSAHRAGKGAGGRVHKGATRVGSSGSRGGDEWGVEGYEVQKVRGVDEVFLRFQERVGREGLQCVR